MTIHCRYIQGTYTHMYNSLLMKMMSGHLDTLTVFCQHETFSISIGDQFIRQDIKKKMVNSITVLQSLCLLFIVHLWHCLGLPQCMFRLVWCFSLFCDLWDIYYSVKKMCIILLLSYCKIPKISLGLIFFEGPFWGAYFWRGLSMEGNLGFKIDWAAL